MSVCAKRDLSQTSFRTSSKWSKLVINIFGGCLAVIMLFRWLGKDAVSEVVLQASRQDPRPPLHDYTVSVITSDVRNAGTDADVYIDVTGEHITFIIIVYILDSEVV